jgi:hypothetical protein
MFFVKIFLKVLRGKKRKKVLNNFAITKETNSGVTIKTCFAFKCFDKLQGEKKKKTEGEKTKKVKGREKEMKKRVSKCEKEKVREEREWK